MSARGRLIAVEGIDASGKSTQAALLAGTLGAMLTHEPGATALGVLLRGLLVESEAAVDPVAEALLLAADRAQHVAEVVRPALDSGQWVVSDRFSASTLAYQGYGRGLPLGQLEALVAWATGGLEADLTVLVDVEPALCRQRKRSGTDRFERLDASFHDRVRQGYRELARAGGERWAVVDGSGPIEQVARAVRAAVEARLGPAPLRRP